MTEEILIGIGVLAIFILGVFLYKVNKSNSSRHVGPRPPKPPKK